MAKTQSNDRLAPHSIEAEEAVLGSILINADALFEVLPFLNADDFFIIRHSWIWEAMLALHGRHDPLDYLTIVNELEQTGRLAEVGGAAYILSLINKTPSALNVEGYGRIVERMAVRRRLINAAQQVARVAHSDETDIDEVISRSEQAIRDATGSRLNNKRVHISQVVARTDDNDNSPTLLTDWKELDEVTDYKITYGRIMTILAASGHFKSTIAGQMVSSWALMGHPVLYVSMEDWPEDIKGQMVRYQAFVNHCTVSEAERRLDKVPMEVISKRQSIADIKSQVLSTGYQNGIVVIDTLQKLTDCEGRNGIETGAVARAAAALDGAKLDTKWLWVVLLQQYLETNTKEISKLRPSRANVRDSKSIYDASDIMLGGYHADDWRHEFGAGWDDDKCPPGMYMIRALKIRRGNKQRKKYELLQVVDSVPALVSPAFMKPPVQQTINLDHYGPARTPAFVAGRDDPGPQAEAAR